MRKFNLIGLLSLAAALLLGSCSKDGSVLATYSDGVKTYNVKIGDIKKDILPYISYNPGIISNAEWHQDFIFDRYIAKDIVFQDKVKAGYTNSAEYSKAFDSEYNKANLVLLFRKGEEFLNNQAKNGKYEVVHPMHILITTSQFTNITRSVVSFTNVNGKRQAVTNWQQEQQKLSDKDYSDLMKSKELVAQNIIDNLKKAGNPEKEFIKTASNISEDYATSRAGGDMGFIPKGYMVKEYEDAVFAAKNKGLLDKPVFTSYGYYIVYIKEPAQLKSLKDIENASGKESFKRMASFFNNSFQDKIRKENIIDKYTLDSVKKAVVIDGKSYKPADLKDDMALLDIYGQPKTWKDCKDLILLYVPDFISSLTIDSFILQMQNYRNFVFMLETAKKNGADKGKDYAKDLETTLDTITKRLVLQTFEKDILDKVNTEMTPQAKKSYYEANKANYFNTIGGKRVQMSFKEADSRISEEMKGQLFRQFYTQWKDDAKSRAKLAFNANGLKDLYGIETEEYKKLSGAQKKK